MTNPFKRIEVSAVDQRGAELAARRKALEADGAELTRLELAQRAAANELSAAEAEKIRHADPLDIDTPAETKEAATLRLRAAREALAKAQAGRAAFPHDAAGLSERARVLRLEEELAGQAATRTEATDILRQTAQHLGEVRRLSAAYDDLLETAKQRWPEAEVVDGGELLRRHAGLEHVMPEGLFAEAQTGIGPRCVVRDHILAIVAKIFPGALAEDMREWALSKAKGPRWSADAREWHMRFPGHSWDPPQSPAAHLDQLPDR